MNQSNKKAPTTKGILQPFKRQKVAASQVKPGAAQLKTGSSAQSVKRPVAPPPYRPQPVPKVLQTKLASRQQSNTAPAHRQPVAPPVYRPEAKRIVQPKIAVAPQTPRPPKAPPVYRPEQKKILQPKLILQPRKPPVAPPAYRPKIEIVQPKIAAARAHTPPNARPVYRAGSSTIQRKVLSKKVSGKTVYYSDQDTSSVFNTREEAELHELTLGLPSVSEGTRGATLYTYTHTKTHCQIPSGSQQGPHTEGYSATSNALWEAEGRQDINNTFLEQVPSPDQWVQMVIDEKGPEVFTGKDEFSRRFQRAREDYRKLYEATVLLLKMKRYDDARFNIGLLMQLHPYATYCWKSKAKPSKKSLKYKGEDSVMKEDSNIDTGGKWKKPEAFKGFLEDKQLLLDDDYDMDGSSSESSSDYSSSDENSSDIDEDKYRTPAIVNHQQVKYWFYDDEIPGGGDCLFNTLIAMGLSNGNSVQQLRDIAAGNGGQGNISTPGIWANTLDITAIANHFGFRIRVLTIAVHGNAVLQDFTYGASGLVYVIGHVHGGHYTPLHHL